MQFPEIVFPTAVNYLGHIDFFPHRELYCFPAGIIRNIDWEASILFF